MTGVGCCFDKSGLEGDVRTVKLRFLRKELLYDIRNYAYVEADVMRDDRVHAKHLTSEVGEEGNVDRVHRILAAVHALVIDLLYPYTRSEAVEEELEDRLCVPEEYVVELHVPASMSRSTIVLLSRLIHEFMVYRALGDWLGITDAEASAKWMEKAEYTRHEIETAKNQRGVFTRRLHPW